MMNSDHERKVLCWRFFLSYNIFFLRKNMKSGLERGLSVSGELVKLTRMNKAMQLRGWIMESIESFLFF